MIIMPDADMGQVVDALMGAGYGSAGERCMAVSVPVPVGEKVADDLMDRMIPLVENLPVGPPADTNAAMGPVITRQSLDRITSLLQSGIDKGAKLLVDGRGVKVPGHENGFFIGASLFDHVTPEMDIYKEEIFGPVLFHCFELQIMRRQSNLYMVIHMQMVWLFSPGTEMLQEILSTGLRLVWLGLTCRFRYRLVTTVLVVGKNQFSEVITFMGPIPFIFTRA